MKRRLIVALTILIALITTFTLGKIFIPGKYHGYLDMLIFLFLVYDIVYLWFGIPRLIVYLIYGIFIAPSLIFFAKEYHLLLIFISTIVIVLNPLAEFENFLDKNLKDNITRTFDYTLPGRYRTFYKYRDEMKNHYHLPQTQKLYTNKIYRSIRTVVLMLLLSLLVFLLIFSSSDIIIGQGIDIRSVGTIYLAIILTIALVILYKKGFSSMFRVFKLGIFPLIIYLFAFWKFNPIAKGISIGVLIAGALSIFITEAIAHYSRVIFPSYNYFDPTSNEKVSANALYEPFVYDSIEKQNIMLEFELNANLFEKQFKTLLVNTNYLRTIITAYTFKKGKVNLYIEYYKEKDILKLERKIKRIYNLDSINKKLIDVKYYETKFLHNHEYIISRAINLSNLLIELEIKEPVIIAVSMHFKNKEQALLMSNSYQTLILEEKENYCLAECSLKMENLDYIIETNLRHLLLEMLINGGTFIRVMVYY